MDYYRKWIRGYRNPYQKQIYRGFSHYVLWQLGYFNESLLPAEMPENFTYPNPLEVIDHQKPKVSWVNHSTFWIEVGGKSFLLDPIWAERCSPTPFVGPRRLHEPPFRLEELGHVDYVVISHNHYDHLDEKTVKGLLKLYPHITWVVPKGVGRWFSRKGIRKVVELEWWESYQEGLDISFQAVPAQHFSGRGLFDRNRALWMGCVVKVGKKSFYFAGDTGYNEHHFKEIGRKCGTPDLSLLPIGVYAPRRFMQAVHTNPVDAIQIHKDVGSKLSIGGHWKTFRLSNEEQGRPPYDLYLGLRREKINVHNFRVLEPGQKINW